MALASITASTGRPKRWARSAALGWPSNKPITPSTMMRSASRAAACRRWAQSASPVIHKSSWCTGLPLANVSQYGSRKSGPHLKTRTRRPWRVCRRASAQATVVLPWPEAGAAMRMVGQRVAVKVRFLVSADSAASGKPRAQAGCSLGACRTLGASAAKAPQRSIFHRLFVP